jgi:hypothetical protein
MIKKQNLVTEKANIFMSDEFVMSKITLVAGIGVVSVQSSHYNKDIEYSKPTLKTRLKNALN